MRFLPFISCLLFFYSCRGPYKQLQRTAADPGCIEKFRPVLGSALYNTSVDVVGKHLSGLLLLKRMQDSSIRVVFSSEMGFKYFDFEFSTQGGFRTYYVIKQMNRKAVVNTLRRDFEMILMNRLPAAPAYALKLAAARYQVFETGKELTSYITDSSCTRLLRIEMATRRKIRVEAVLQHYSNGLPDSIGIRHRNFHFTIGLKRLER